MNLRIKKNTHQQQQESAMAHGRGRDSRQGAPRRTADRDSSQGAAGHGPPVGSRASGAA